MLIFVHGENTYSALEHVENMREKFVSTYDQSGMNLAEFPGTSGKIEIGAVMQSVQTPPFLGEKRMVIVKGLLEDVTTKPKAEPWVNSFKKIPAESIVILVNALPAKKIEKNHLYKSFAGHDEVHVYDFPLLEGAKLNAWATKKCTDLGLQIDRSLLNRVIAMVGGDLWQLSNELEKLAAFANGQVVSEEMVRDLVKANFEDQMFAFVDAVSQKKAAKALQLLDEQRQSGSTDFHLFGMLARQVRLLLGARSVLERHPQANKAVVAKEMGVHPFVAQKVLAQARSFDAETLQSTHQLLFDLDRKIKTGGVAADVAVDRIVAEMVR